MIYFAQPVDGGPIKIGTTENLDSRLYALERHYGCLLALLATMEGGREREVEIHAQFAHLRFGRTEQFRPAPDLLTFIGRPLLVGANPDVVEAMKGRRLGYRYIRMDDELCEKARKLAALRGVSMAEMFSDALRPWIDREWKKEVRQLKEDEP